MRASALGVTVNRPLGSLLLAWLLVVVSTLLPLHGHAAEALDLQAPPAEELGTRALMVSESGRRLSVREALAALQLEGKPGRSRVLNPGIGQPALWLQLDLHNPGTEALDREILLGQSWLDHIEVWILRGDEVERHWQTGDETAGQPGLHEVHGYVFRHRFDPGSHRLLVRVQTEDPLTVNLRLRTPAQAESEATRDRYLYGFLYGFIVSLMAYNLMLYVGLRLRVYLLYALYLLSFLVLNLAYTGRGAVWLWGDWVTLQRYSNVSLIVLMPTAGLFFAREFLKLSRLAPRLDRWVLGGSLIGPVLLLLAMAAGAYQATVWLAFVVLGLFIVVMVGLGVHAVRRGQSAARFFLMGALCSMLGTALTEFSVWGFIPFSVWAYRGIELGMMMDAALLALALAEVVRTEVAQRRAAEHRARIDPLTQLLNRRGFTEEADAHIATATRAGRPLSLALLDVDHFKRVNDRHGHLVGDGVLVEVAGSLQQITRINDRGGRWGGEEFALLMPETDLDAAREMCERVRATIERTAMPGPAEALWVTASFGVAQWRPGESLVELAARADEALYRAKSSGRNRVEMG